MQAQRFRRTSLLQAVVLVLPLALIAGHYRRTWYFYDEWSVVDYTSRHHSGADAFLNFNGHLWVLSYLVYRAQTALFGLTGHALVWTCFLASLLGWAAGTRWLLRELQVPGWLATVAACAVVYGGFAAQNLSFEIQLAPNTAFGLGLSAAACAVRWRNVRGSVLAAVLLTLALGCDSSVALLILGYLLVLVVVLALPDRRMTVSVTAPLLVPVALGAWFFLSQPKGPSFGAPLGQSLRFGGRLALASAGGPVGGAVRTGAVVLVLYAAALLVGWRRRALTRLSVATLAGATCATVLAVSSLMVTRSGFDTGNPADTDRYLSEVGVFILLGALPVCCAVATRGQTVPIPVAFEATAVAVLLLAFALNLRTLHDYRSGFESWNLSVKKQVAALPCPLPPDTVPLPALSPQITGALLNQLQRAGALIRSGPGCQ